jgi:hypothetical protein
MPQLFGYEVETDAEIKQDKRQDRFKWILYSGFGLIGFYTLVGDLPLGFLRSYIATVLFYGEAVYVQHKSELKMSWFRKAILLSVPAHALYVYALFWLDKVTTSKSLFLGLLALFFAFESMLFDKLVNALKPLARPVGANRPPAEPS